MRELNGEELELLISRYQRILSYDDVLGFPLNPFTPDRQGEDWDLGAENHEGGMAGPGDQLILRVRKSPGVKHFPLSFHPPVAYINS